MNPNRVVLFILCNLAILYIAWYAFEFIEPVAGWLIITLHILLLINFPYQKLTKNENSK